MVSLGDWALPYQRNVDAYARTEAGGHLFGGGSFHDGAHHHPLEEGVLTALRAQTAFAAKNSEAAAATKARTMAGPESTVAPHQWGNLGGTSHCQPTTVEEIEARIKAKSKPTVGGSMPCGGGSSFCDTSGIPADAQFTHHMITPSTSDRAHHEGLLANTVLGRAPPSYATMCDVVMHSRRVSPSYPGAPQAARRPGVHCDSADAVDAEKDCNELGKAALYRSELAIQQVAGPLHVSHEEPLMMAQLDRAAVHASLKQSESAQVLAAEAERKCPGIRSRYRHVGWPPNESTRIVQTCGGFNDFDGQYASRN